MRGKPISASPSTWRHVGLVAGVFLGLVFLIAAWAKAIDPVAFAEQITAEGLDFALPAGVVGWLAIVLETVLGLALVLGIRRRIVLVPTGLLVVFFLFLTGRAYWRFLSGVEETTSCGCFGNLLSRTPQEAFWQDLSMLLPPFVLACLWTDPVRAVAKWKVALVAIVAVLAGWLVWRSPALPLDELATRLKPGVEVVDLCAGSASDPGEQACLDLLVPELGVGRHLVIIDDLEGKTLEKQIDRLNGMAQSGELADVWVLSDATTEEQTAFFWQWAPAFQTREVPLALLRPLYRALPRSFLVDDGVVTRTWSDYPSVEEGDTIGNTDQVL